MRPTASIPREIGASLSKDRIGCQNHAIRRLSPTDDICDSDREILKGEQPAIVDRALFDAVQAKLNEQATNHKTSRMQSEALLAGRIFDDRGNRMSPTHARKGGVKYRYYLSSALLHNSSPGAQRLSAMTRSRSCLSAFSFRFHEAPDIT